MTEGTPQYPDNERMQNQWASRVHVQREDSRLVEYSWMHIVLQFCDCQPSYRMCSYRVPVAYAIWEAESRVQNSNWSRTGIIEGFSHFSLVV
jgi:hypothetical protein